MILLDVLIAVFEVIESIVDIVIFICSMTFVYVQSLRPVSV